MHRLVTRLLILCAILSAPVLTYEACQKAYESYGMRGSWARLSARAEQSTRWRPKTGSFLMDHALHELEETRIFYRLAARELTSRR